MSKLSDANQQWRILAVAFAGFCTFLDLYATQPLLPLFRQLFHASTAQVGMTVSASTFAVALAAPPIGLIADRVGRKPVILAAIIGLTFPTLLAASSHSLNTLIFWRFLQGLFMPGIFAVTMAYISEEWPTGTGAAMAGYITGNVLGGFSGRFISGLAAEHGGGWREAFVILGILNAIGAVIVWRFLPPSRNFKGEPDWHASLRAMTEHLRNKILLATFAVGFNVLFSMVATFTYITFYLAAPPFRLGTGALGSLFFVYLIGAVVTPTAGKWIDRFGHRLALGSALLLSSLGVLCTLTHSLIVVVLGLAICCTGIFISQSAGGSFVGVAADRAKSSATGLYVTFYYIGGSLGALLPGLAYAHGGWPACVALIVSIQVITAGLALLFWRMPEPPPEPLSSEIQF